MRDGLVTRQERIGGAAIAALIQVGLGFLLLSAFGVKLPGKEARDAINLFAVTPPPPPPDPIEHHLEAHPKHAGKASPANLHAKPTEVVAPTPVVPLPPLPMIAAPVAGTGTLARAGAANVKGPGTGAGGIGNGLGSGNGGNGDGDDGETPPEQIKGRIKDSDYPRAAAEASASGTVSVKFRVNTDGRPSDCQITHSSGNAALDSTTCALILQRFRYKPSLDADGRPVVSYLVEDHSWETKHIRDDGDAS
jgi:periplasmic protein TonB